MKYYYGEFDGSEFPTPDQLFGFDQLMQFILQYGEQALKAIEQMMQDPKNEAQAEMLAQLLEEGMIEKDGKGKLRLTPRAVNKMQRKALMEVFANLRMGTREGHEKITPGLGGDRIEGTKPYEYGRPGQRTRPAPDAAQRPPASRPAQARARTGSTGRT